MSVAAIRTNILAKLNAMQSLKAAYDYEANELTSYPAACLTLAAGEGEFASTAHNKRVREFRVNLYVDRGTAFSSAAAEDLITAVVDEAEAAIDHDVTLSGACSMCVLSNWVALYEDREIDTRVAELTIRATELVRAQ